MAELLRYRGPGLQCLHEGGAYAPARRCAFCAKRDEEAGQGQPWLRSLAELRWALEAGDFPVRVWLDGNGEEAVLHADTGDPEYTELYHCHADAVLEEALALLGIPFDRC